MNILLSAYGWLISLADFIRRLPATLRREMWGCTADRVGYTACAVVLLIVYAAIELTDGGAALTTNSGR